MTTAWAGSGSVGGSNEHHLMTRQSGFVGNHELELMKRPSVELRTLLRAATLTAIADTAKVFQHNEAVGWETIDEATANGMQVVACPTAFLVAQPYPSFFSLSCLCVAGYAVGHGTACAALSTPHQKS